MKTDCTESKLRFQGHGRREVVAGFDGGTMTSDAGGLLLRELELGRKLISRFAACFRDLRDPRRIEHTLLELLKQRIFGLCLGYEDLNDHDLLRRDPHLALLCGKDDLEGARRKRERDRGAALAGKSTLDRLELTRPGATAEERYSKIVCDEAAVERFFVEVFLDAHQKAPERIWLDLDTTDIPLHGEQEERFFHGYYDEYCYLPLYVFSGHFVLVSLLRPAYLDASVGAEEMLVGLLERIRARWPDVHIILRADSGFCRDELMAWVEQRKEAGAKLDYLFGLAGNSRLLEKLAEPMRQAQALHELSGEAARIFAEFDYRTRDSWSRSRRVVGKAEHIKDGANPRFIVTSLCPAAFPAQELYENHYCGRGDAENRIKEQQLGLFADRASSSYFSANQLRVYFSAVAYTVLNELRRLALASTQLAQAQCWTVRNKLLKIGARLVVSARRVRLFMASGHPWQELFATALRNLRLASAELRL